MADRPSHYFDATPGVTSRRNEVVLALPDARVTLTTDRGVFGHDRVDPGTKLLLLHAPPPPDGGNLLDLGCGYGPIAVTLARRAPRAAVWAVDVNERARQLCAENAARLGLARVTAVAPDDVPVGIRFDAIWSNPPIRIGKAALHELLRTWLGRLTSDGVAVLVVHQHLGATSLASWLQHEGWTVERLAIGGGYRVLGVRSV